MEDNNVILCEFVHNNIEEEWEVDEGGGHYLCIEPDDYLLSIIDSDDLYYYHLGPQAKMEWGEKIRRAVSDFTSLLGHPVELEAEYAWEVKEAQADLVRKKLKEHYDKYGLTYEEYNLKE